MWDVLLSPLWLMQLCGGLFFGSFLRLFSDYFGPVKNTRLQQNNSEKLGGIKQNDWDNCRHIPVVSSSTFASHLPKDRKRTRKKGRQSSQKSGGVASGILYTSCPINCYGRGSEHIDRAFLADHQIAIFRYLHNRHRKTGKITKRYTSGDPKDKILNMVCVSILFNLDDG